MKNTYVTILLAAIILCTAAAIMSVAQRPSTQAADYDVYGFISEADIPALLSQATDPVWKTGDQHIEDLFSAYYDSSFLMPWLNDCEEIDPSEKYGQYLYIKYRTKNGKSVWLTCSNSQVIYKTIGWDKDTIVGVDCLGQTVAIY